MSETETITIYVSLLDEGTATIRPTKAISLGDGLYEIMAIPSYDPEDESWEFVPGNVVRVRPGKDRNGIMIPIAAHANPDVITAYVVSNEFEKPMFRETHAIPDKDGFYRLLATPHYEESQRWEFPPGSLVRLEKRKTAMKNWQPLTAVERIDD